MKTERHYDFHIGNEVFESGTHIMAILNVTPDSFLQEVATRTMRSKRQKILGAGCRNYRYRRSVHSPRRAKRKRARRDGKSASCRGKHKKEFPDALVSVDTFYPDVAQAAIDVGADMINDVSCLLDKILQR